MANTLIDRRFYDAIVNFEVSESAQDYYYSVMNAEMDRDGKKDTVRNLILRAYSMLFCDDLGALPGQVAGPDDVEATADRLHTGADAIPGERGSRIFPGGLGKAHVARYDNVVLPVGVVVVVGTGMAAGESAEVVFDVEGLHEIDVLSAQLYDR